MGGSSVWAVYSTILLTPEHLPRQARDKHSKREASRSVYLYIHTGPVCGYRCGERAVRAGGGVRRAAVLRETPLTMACMMPRGTQQRSQDSLLIQCSLLIQRSPGGWSGLHGLILRESALLPRAHCYRAHLASRPCCAPFRTARPRQTRSGAGPPAIRGFLLCTKRSFK